MQLVVSQLQRPLFVLRSKANYKSLRKADYIRIGSGLLEKFAV